MTRCHKTAVEKWAVLLSQRKLLRESEEIDRIERKAASRELYWLTLGILWENSDWSKLQRPYSCEDCASSKHVHDTNIVEWSSLEAPYINGEAGVDVIATWPLTFVGEKNCNGNSSLLF